MTLTIEIDNQTIDEGIPGLKVGTLSAGGVAGTFTISNLPKYNGNDIPIFEIKGNDLYLSENWIANFENKLFENFPSIGNVWAYSLSPKITFKSIDGKKTAEKVIAIDFNDLDEKISLTSDKIFKNILGAKVATIGGVDPKFKEFILGWNNKHDLFDISGDKLKLKENYYFDGEKIVNSLNGKTHQIDSIPDLKINVKGGISFYYNGSGDPTYGDTVFKGTELKAKFLNVANTKIVDNNLIKLVPQVFSTNEFGTTIATISILDKDITPNQLLLKANNSCFEIAKTIHNDDSDVKDQYSYELRLKEKYYFDGVQIKDFKGNKINLTESQDLFDSTEFIGKFFSINNFVSKQEIEDFNHLPSIVSNIRNFIVNSESFEYQFEAFDIDNQSARFPTDPSKLFISGNSVASSQAVLDKVEKIAVEKGTPAFASLIGDKNGVIEFGMTGIRSVDTDIPIFFADRFLLASCSKSMTGFLIAKFVDDGKLTWDSKIPSLFPNIKNIHEGFKNVTMKDLMDHTSGIPYATKHQPDWNETDIAKQRAGFAEKVFTDAPEISDYAYNYANVNQALAAAALEKISGKSWETLMQDYIFTPLGMNDSGFGPATVAGIDQPARHDLNESSQIYKTMKANNPGEDIHWWKVPDGVTKFASGDLKAVDGNDNSQFIGPAAKITMSIWDWAKYATATLNKGNFGNFTMKPESWKSFITPDSGTYSGGWNTSTPSGEETPTFLFHRGAVMGWRSNIEVDLNKGYYVIGFSNEAYFQGHPELNTYLKDNYNTKVKSEYSIDLSKEVKTDATTYSMEKGPGWLSFDNKTGLLKGKATSSNIGNHNIKLKATDAAGATVTENIVIEVKNNKQISLTDHYDTYNGTNKNDKIWGSNGNDVIIGNEGNDLLVGAQGNDYVDGGSGNDVLTLEPDAIWGKGYSAANMSSGVLLSTVSVEGKKKYQDVLDGGLDNDTIILGDKSDVFALDDAFSGFHQSISLTKDLFGKENNARIKAIEKINAQAGNDVIDLTSPTFELSNKILIEGGIGNDVIWASSGPDTLNGGDGDDVLFGGKGIDNLIGGSGADTFEFCNQSGNDIIKDYNKADGDKLVFYKKPNDTENILLENSEMIKWGPVYITLEGTSLKSIEDLTIEFISVA